MSDQDDPRSEGVGGRPPSEGEERRRYFTDSMGSGQASNRHRRRRAPGDPTTTGSIPIVRVGDSLPDPTIEYRTPERPEGEPSPYFQVQYRSTEVEGLSFTEPRTSPYASEPPTVVNPPTRHPATPPVPQRPPAAPTPAPPAEPAPAAEPVGLFDILDATQDEPVRPEPAQYEPPQHEPAQYETHQYETAQYETDQYETDRDSGAPAGEVTEAGLRLPSQTGANQTPVRDTPVLDTPVRDSPVRDSSAPLTAATYTPTYLDGPDFTDDGPDEDSAGRSMPARKRNRKVLVALLSIALIIVLVVAGLGLKMMGVFDSSKDYSSTVGEGAALVHVESDSSIRDIGDTLADAGVVGSRKAFVDATGNDTVSAGFYKLPKGISAAAAVQKMQGNENRVGFVVIPEGRQLDTKKGADGKTTPGIFQMIADATTVKTDDATYGVTVEQLMEAADKATADDLGIPTWARETFDKLGDDHRRIEGLIASGAWENLDPRQDATQILHSLITDSANRFTAWGIESDNNTGLTPYQTLVTASIVEREASVDEDFPKVARVILNRLKVDQRLEMDSTANYTADVQNIDLGGAAYKDENAWNTYQHKGLPITPIGAVGERALNATVDPATGNWLYFVTVDKDGKTLFSRTFEQHKKNRQVACDNKLLVTGC